MIISYLKNHTQITKAGSSCSELHNIIYGVPPESILGPFLFIIYIYIWDLFIVNKDVNFSSYADDTIPFITGMSFEQIIPESILSDISQWFMSNNLKADSGKFHLFLSLYEEQTITVEN